MVVVVVVVAVVVVDLNVICLKEYVSACGVVCVYVYVFFPDCQMRKLIETSGKWARNLESTGNNQATEANLPAEFNGRAGRAEAQLIN